MVLRVGLIGYGSWTRMAYIPALQRDGAHPNRLGSRAQRGHAATHRLRDSARMSPYSQMPPIC